MASRAKSATQALVQMYYKNPDAFSDTEVNQLMQLTTQHGIKFSPKTTMGRMAKIAGMSALDTALFGVLPNKWTPTARTTSEKIAGGVGDIGGLFAGLPGVAALKAAGVVGRAVPKAAAKLAADRGGTAIGKSLAQLTSKGGKKVTEKLLGYGYPLREAEALAGRFANFRLGRAEQLLGGALGRKGVQQALQRGARYGTMLGTYDLMPNLQQGRLDRVIEQALGGATLGVIGRAIQAIPARNRLFNIRNIARLVVANAAAQGIEANEEDVVNRILQFVATFR